MSGARGVCMPGTDDELLDRVANLRIVRAVLKRTQPGEVNSVEDVARLVMHAFRSVSVVVPASVAISAVQRCAADKIVTLLQTVAECGFDQLSQGSVSLLNEISASIQADVIRQLCGGVDVN